MFSTVATDYDVSVGIFLDIHPSWGVDRLCVTWYRGVQGVSLTSHHLCCLLIAS